MPSSCLPLAFLSLLPSALSAQAGNGHIPIDSVSNGAYGATVSGDLDDNASPEIATIRVDQADALIVFHNPDITADFATVTTGVRDVCYLPIPDAQGRMGLLLATAGGLKIARFDPNPGPFAGSGQYEVVVPGGQTAEMQLAQLVRFGKDGSIYFHAPVGAERRFYRVEFNGANFSTPIHLGNGPAYPVLDFLPLDYVAGGELELAILHGNGLQIRPQVVPPATWNSIPALVARAATVAGDAITKVTIASAGECVAWLTRATSNPLDTRLILFHPSLLSSAGYPTLTLGEVQYASAAAGDINGDGLEDLVLGRGYAQIDTYYQNTSSVKFDTEPNQTTPMALEGALPIATPMGRIVCDNLHNDRRPSGLPIPGYAAILPQDNVLRVVPGEDAMRGALVVNELGDTVRDFQSASFVCDQSTSCNQTTTTADVWNFELGQGWGSMPQANALQVVVRTWVSTGEATGNVAAAAFHNFRVYLPAASGNDLNGFTFSVSSASFRVGNCAERDPGQGYFVQVRPVQVNYPTNAVPGALVDPSLETVAFWRWSVLGFTGTSSHVDVWRNTPYNLTPEMEVCSYDCLPWLGGTTVGDTILCPGLTVTGGRIIPVVVPMSRVPPTPGVLPYAWDWNY